MIAVAIDEDVPAVRAGCDGITYPVLIDAEHIVAELYAISNVPTVLMIDECDNIVQPNWSAYASDTFRELTGIDSEKQKDHIRAWAKDGTLRMSSDDAKGVVDDLSAEEEEARLVFRIAAKLRRDGDTIGAERNFERANALAPNDWTVRRASQPLRGVNPFGDAFMEIYTEFNEAGRPYHGVTGH